MTKLGVGPDNKRSVNADGTSFLRRPTPEETTVRYRFQFGLIGAGKDGPQHTVEIPGAEAKDMAAAKKQAEKALIPLVGNIKETEKWFLLHGHKITT